MLKASKLKWFWLAPLFLFLPGFGQQEAPIKITALKGTFEKARSILQLECELHIPPPWHINSDSLAQAYLIPTRIVFEDSKKLQPLKRSFPKPDTLELFGEKVDVFQGDLKFSQLFYVSSAFPLKGKLQYQACSDNICLPPKFTDFTLEKAAGSNIKVSFP